MFRAFVRKSVSLVVVIVILLGSMLLASCGPYEINIILDLSYLVSNCDLSEEETPDLTKLYLPPDAFEEFPFTVGEFIAILLADLTGPDSTCSNVPTDVALYVTSLTEGTRILPNDSTLNFLAGVTEETTLYFGPAPKNGEITRLTLFGYVFDDGGSCVLWSLDGSPNARPNEKCGGEVELVCTVRLVEKELKPNCKDGYDWLGFNIAHDSQWLSWAHEFASQNGNK